MKVTGTVVVGAGAGGLGPLVYAARNGLLDGWLRQGLTVVEPRPEPASRLGRYALLADSFSPSFLEGLDGPQPHPLLQRVRGSAEGRALLRLADERPPLAVVGAFLRRLESEIEATMNAFPGADIATGRATRFVRGRAAQALYLHEDRVEVDMAGTGERVAGRTVILALGGEALASEAPFGSDRLLTEEGITAALRQLSGAARPEVMIVGASHSAFSAAWLLTERAPEGLLAPGAITVVARRRPVMFYRSVAEARLDGYEDFTAEDLCPRTGKVHQLGGLRGDGRELWRRIHGKPGTRSEPRVQLLDAVRDAEEVRDRLARATMVIPATGYAPRRLPTFAGGHAIALRSSRTADTVGSSIDERCRVLTASGVPLAPGVLAGDGVGLRALGDDGGRAELPRSHQRGVAVPAPPRAAGVRGDPGCARAAREQVVSAPLPALAPPPTVALILAGGEGARLWPLSTARRPKPFRALFGREPAVAFVVQQCRAWLGVDEAIALSVGRGHLAAAAEAIPSFARHRLFVEERLEGTTVAIARVAVAILAEPGERADTVLVVLAADQRLSPDRALVAALDDAVRCASTGRCLVSVGVRPDRPSSAYGYMQLGAPLAGFSGAFAAEGYCEKPPPPVAERLFAAGRSLWNAGVFVFRVDTLVAALRRFVPELVAAIEAGTELPRVYRAIDFELMERLSADDPQPPAFVAARCAFADLGNLEALAQGRRDARGNLVRGEAVLDACEGCTVLSEPPARVRVTGMRDTDVAVGSEGNVLVSRPGGLRRGALARHRRRRVGRR